MMKLPPKHFSTIIHHEYIKRNAHLLYLKQIGVKKCVLDKFILSSAQKYVKYKMCGGRLFQFPDRLNKPIFRIHPGCRKKIMKIPACLFCGGESGHIGIYQPFLRRSGL